MIHLLVVSDLVVVGLTVFDSVIIFFAAIFVLVTFSAFLVVAVVAA
jgi:hypothetical protein